MNKLAENILFVLKPLTRPEEIYDEGREFTVDKLTFLYEKVKDYCLEV